MENVFVMNNGQALIVHKNFVYPVVKRMAFVIVEYVNALSVGMGKTVFWVKNLNLLKVFKHLILQKDAPKTAAMPDHVNNLRAFGNVHVTVIIMAQIVNLEWKLNVMMV